MKVNRLFQGPSGFQELLGALLIVGIILVLPLAGIGIVISGISKGIRRLFNKI